MVHTATWKQLERTAAEVLGGTRVSRGMDFGVSDVDVKIDDFPTFKVDTKRYKHFAAFSLYETVQKKYCKKPEDKPILILRQSGKRHVLAVIDLNLLAGFMDYVREKKDQIKFN